MTEFHELRRAEDAAATVNSQPCKPIALGGCAGAMLPFGRLVPVASAMPAVVLTVDLVTDIEGIRALAPDYQHLYEVVGDVLPFSLQEWHLAWCDHFLNRGPRIRDRPVFCVVREESGECVAIVPLILTQRRLGPFRFASVALIGADPGLTEIRDPLVKPGYEQVTVRAVHGRLTGAHNWTWIQWSSISPALAAALAGETRAHWYETHNDYLLDLPSSWEEFRRTFKRNIRESLRHCYNSLRRAGHSFEFLVAREPDEVRLALDRFLQLHALRATMPSRPKHPNHFDSWTLQSFLYDLCRRLAARDAVRVFQLRIGGNIVASRIAFVTGDSLYLYYSGFDPAWARYSVMTTTVAEALRYAIENGFRTVNLSLTAEQSKLRWRPRLVEYRSALVQRNRLSSRIACAAYLALSRQGKRAQLLRNLIPHRKWS